MGYRIGQGFDVHRFSDEADGTISIRLAGVDVPHTATIIAHSDGDVVIHALCDALLGALALGDIGQHFPDTDPAYAGIDSLELLQAVYQLIRDRNWLLENADMTVIAQQPRLAPHIPEMRRTLARALAVSEEQVSIKATTSEGLGFTGREEGIAASAVIILCNDPA